MLSVVVLSVDFKDPDEELGHVLEAEVEMHRLVSSELGLVGGEEFDFNCASQLLELGVLVLLHFDLLTSEEAGLLLDELEFELLEVGEESGEGLLLLNQEVLEVALHNARVLSSSLGRVSVVAPL